MAYNGQTNAQFTSQLNRILQLMIDGQWRKVSDIAFITGDPENSIQAQLRHLRKKKFGSYIVEKRHLGKGLWEYRVLPPISTQRIK